MSQKSNLSKSMSSLSTKLLRQKPGLNSLNDQKNNRITRTMHLIFYYCPINALTLNTFQTHAFLREQLIQ